MHALKHDNPYIQNHELVPVTGTGQDTHITPSQPSPKGTHRVTFSVATPHPSCKLLHLCWSSPFRWVFSLVWKRFRPWRWSPILPTQSGTVLVLLYKNDGQRGAVASKWSEDNVPNRCPGCPKKQSLCRYLTRALQKRETRQEGNRSQQSQALCKSSAAMLGTAELWCENYALGRYTSGTVYTQR